MKGLEHFNLTSVKYSKGGIEVADPTQGGEASKSNESGEAKKEEDKPILDKEGKVIESKKEEDKKIEDLTDEELLTQATSRAGEIKKISEDKRTDKDKEFLVTFGKLEDIQEPAKEATGYKELIEELSSDNVLEIVEGTEYEDSKEGFVQLIEDNRSNAVTQFRKELPEEVEDILKFVVDGGGEIGDYLDSISETDYSKVDVSNEYNQRLMVATSMGIQGYNAEDVETKIELYQDNNMLEKEAKVAQGQLEKDRKSRVLSLQKRQKEIADDRTKKTEEKRSEFKTSIDGLTDISGIPVSKRDVQQLRSYMARPVRNNKTQWQLDSEKVSSQIMQAFFTMKGFDLDKISARQKSKVVSDIRTILAKGGDVNVKKVDSGIRVEAEEGGKGGEKLIIPELPWLRRGEQ